MLRIVPFFCTLILLADVQVHIHFMSDFIQTKYVNEYKVIYNDSWDELRKFAKKAK